MTRQFLGTSNSISVDYLICEEDTALYKPGQQTHKTRPHLFRMFKLR